MNWTRGKRRKPDREKKLDQLCDAHGVSRSMGELFLSELRELDEPANARDQKALERAQILGLIPRRGKPQVSSFEKTIEEQEQERFNNLPAVVRKAALEYFGYMGAMHRGYELSHEDMKKTMRLAAVVDKHKITALCFEADLFPDR